MSWTGRHRVRRQAGHLPGDGGALPGRRRGDPEVPPRAPLSAKRMPLYRNSELPERERDYPIVARHSSLETRSIFALDELRLQQCHRSVGTCFMMYASTRLAPIVLFATGDRAGALLDILPRHREDFGSHPGDHGPMWTMLVMYSQHPQEPAHACSMFVKSPVWRACLSFVALAFSIICHAALLCRRDRTQP